MSADFPLIPVDLNRLNTYSGDNPLFTSTLVSTLAPTLMTAVRAVDWDPTIAAIMVGCNILAIAFGKFTIQQPSVGPTLPAANLFGGFGLGAVIGTTCFGHVLGAGVILGLTNIGVL